MNNIEDLVQEFKTFIQRTSRTVQIRSFQKLYINFVRTILLLITPYDDDISNSYNFSNIDNYIKICESHNFLMVSKLLIHFYPQNLIIQQPKRNRRYNKQLLLPLIYK